MAAIAFGNFQKQLADYPIETLKDTIPNFHNTASRFNDFKIALEENKSGRKNEALPEIEFVLAREKDCSILTTMLENGELPLRVTHNDTKLNNVMLDVKTGEPVAVIDLDTIMPGSICYDFGDSIRFGCSTAPEDEKDLSKVNFNIDLFDVYTRGYLTALGKDATDIEKEYLPWGAILMTFECGIRFLTDYLDGDVYFRIKREEHNLDRCRTQLKLVADMEKVLDKMNALVK